MHKALVKISSSTLSQRLDAAVSLKMNKGHLQELQEELHKTRLYVLPVMRLHHSRWKRKMKTCGNMQLKRIPFLNFCLSIFFPKYFRGSVVSLCSQGDGQQHSKIVWF